MDYNQYTNSMNILDSNPGPLLFTVITDSIWLNVAFVLFIWGNAVSFCITG